MRGVNIFFLFLFIFNCGIVFAEITGEIITGEITSKEVSMNISVILNVPTLSISSPKNQTYFSNESLLFSYSVFNADSIWYNIDGGENMTLFSSLGSFNLNVKEGEHIIYLYANNSDGFVADNVSFFVDLDIFKIDFLKWKGLGNSTDFYRYSYEDIQSLEGITIENMYGKIYFNKKINLVDDNNSLDNFTNLSEGIDIFSNKIEVDGNLLPNFNKEAILWFYNLDFSNPRVLKDGVVCSADSCLIKSYSNGNLEVLVDGFSVYSVEETPKPEIPSSGGGGGGGGSKIDKDVVDVIYDFSLDKNEFKILLKQGDVRSGELVITNIGNQRMNFTITGSEIIDMIRIDNNSFGLNSFESKKIFFDFFAREDIVPDLYLGKIIVSSGDYREEVFVAIEVVSRGALFDVDVNILEESREILLGEELLANLEVFNFGEQGRVDVELEYIIKDKIGNELFSESEMIAVETRANLFKSFSIPEDLGFGDYVLYARLLYGEEVASSSEWFIIKERNFFEDKIYYIFGILFFVIIFLIIFLIIKRKKGGVKKKRKKRKEKM